VHWTKDLERWFEDGVAAQGLGLLQVHATRIHIAMMWMKAKLSYDPVVIIALTRIGQNSDHTLDYASYRDEPIDWCH
jgi:hypothetical protein